MLRPAIPVKHLWQDRERRQYILFSVLPSILFSIHVPRWPFLQGHILSLRIIDKRLAHLALIQSPSMFYSWFINL